MLFDSHESKFLRIWCHVGEIVAGGVTIDLSCVLFVPFVVASLVPCAGSTIPWDGDEGTVDAEQFAADDGNPGDVVVDDVGGSEGGGSKVACADEALPLPVGCRLVSADLGVAMPCPSTALT